MSRPATPAGSETSGRGGEQLAAAWLQRQGFAVHGRNVRTVHGEIDVLARRRRTWIAVEVKARRDHPAPERMVDAIRLDRLGRSLQALAGQLRPTARRLRIDVIAVRWRDDAPPEVLHFPALRSWQRLPKVALGSPTAHWSLDPSRLYSAAADEDDHAVVAWLRRLGRFLGHCVRRESRPPA